MDGPIVPTPDHSRLLAKRSVEEEQGLPPQPADGLNLVRKLFAIALVIGAVVSVCVVVFSS